MTVPPTIESLHIRGFRSLADVEIESLPRVALLIGANGSGKSNLICFFELLSWMLKSRRLAEFVGRQGGADDQLFRGSKVTPRIEAEISMRSEGGRHEYRFALDYADPDRFIFSSEAFRRLADSDAGADEGWTELGSGHSEARLVEVAQGREFDEPERTAAQTILHVLRGCATYHFHDTSGSSRMKQSWDVEDAVQLRPDGGNLGPVLLRLERHEIRRYEWICRQIGRILPGFDRFDVTQQFGKALLGWKAKGSDKRIGAHLTSDGSLRFFALVTLLNLPPEMLPDLLLLDEPELGLTRPRSS